MTRAFVSPSTGREVRAVLFDTFGSVVDWRAGVAREVATVMREHGQKVDAEQFADAWRRRYEPAMEPIRAGDRPFAPHDVLHRENLDATLGEFGFTLPSDAADTLSGAWERLDGWPDSVDGLSRLRRRVIVGPLSNGNVALLTRMAKHAGLPGDVIVGADVTARYKPHPEAYLRTAALLRLEPGELMLAAAHNDDLAAARAAGLATAFIVRPTEFGPGQTTDLGPQQDWDVVSDSIAGLAAELGG